MLNDIRQPLLLAIAILILGSSSGWCQTKALTIGTDQNHWYPFTYLQKAEAKGIHIDIVTRALRNLGYQFTYKPLPWKRCLQQAANGKVDAIVSASYGTDRNDYLFYPPDASVSKKSQWRITQVEYVVLTFAGSTYAFTGDVLSLPSPVRAPLGYSIVDDLKAKGVDVVSAKDIRMSMEQLIQSKRGVVITPPQNARYLRQDTRFGELFKIHSLPVKSKSYFMAFAKRNRQLEMGQLEGIWNEIARLREDQAYLTQLFNRYAQTP